MRLQACSARVCGTPCHVLLKRRPKLNSSSSGHRACLPVDSKAVARVFDYPITRALEPSEHELANTKS